MEAWLRCTRTLMWPALLGAALGASCRSEAARDPVILAFGEEVVRRSDFERHVAGLEAQGGGALPVEVRQALLEPWLEERVLVLEARQRGLLKPGASPDDERRAVEAPLAECSRVSVGDDEVAAYYREHPDEFHRPRPWSCARSWCPPRTRPATCGDGSRRTHGASSPWPASVEGPEAATGGLMGTFARGQLPPELEAAAFALPRAASATSWRPLSAFTSCASKSASPPAKRPSRRRPAHPRPARGAEGGPERPPVRVRSHGQSQGES